MVLPILLLGMWGDHRSVQDQGREGIQTVAVCALALPPNAAEMDACIHPQSMSVDTLARWVVTQARRRA